MIYLLAFLLATLPGDFSEMEQAPIEQSELEPAEWHDIEIPEDQIHHWKKPKHAPLEEPTYLPAPE
ncbi:MAG: hypothetical protein KDK65_06055 [Chlamydiia bacterium]|nr:hypothetical protein [Chlamydiia bacterium]